MMERVNQYKVWAFAARSLKLIVSRFESSKLPQPLHEAMEAQLRAFYCAVWENSDFRPEFITFLANDFVEAYGRPWRSKWEQNYAAKIANLLATISEIWQQHQYNTAIAFPERSDGHAVRQEIHALRGGVGEFDAEHDTRYDFDWQLMWFCAQRLAGENNAKPND